jgi:hypothetical protein
VHRAGLPYAVGISSTQTVFVGTPRLTPPAPAAGIAPTPVAALVATWPAAAWRTITWRNAPGARRCRGRFAAQRVTPAHDWRQRVLAPEIWLLAEQVGGATPRTKYYFVHLPAHHRAARAGALDPPALGHRAAVSRIERRVGP